MRGFIFIAATTFDYGDGKEKILPMIWNNETRYMYFQEGGYFILHNENPLALIDKVIAHYSTNEIATIQSYFGKGRVSVTGVHPEAPDSWKPTKTLFDPD